MIDRLSLALSPCTTSGQETERVYSYNPGARTGQKTRHKTPDPNLGIRVARRRLGTFVSERRQPRLVEPRVILADIGAGHHIASDSHVSVLDDTALVISELQ